MRERGTERKARERTTEISHVTQEDKIKQKEQPSAKPAGSVEGGPGQAV